MEEATLLLVRDNPLPGGLDEQLEKRQVFFEETTAGELFGALELVGPDLVVYAGKDDAAAVADAAEGQARPIPLVVIVDRKEQRALRQLLGSRVGAFVASDLPAGALAQRLATYVQRARKGQPLEMAPLASAAPQPATEKAAPEKLAPAATKLAPEKPVPERAAPLRLALIDDDLGRADPIATELRARGFDVRLVSPEHGQARWPVLRRFAPHGIIVDERSLSKGTRQIVGAFRRDPFLRYVPLVAIGFSRLYRESEQEAHVAPLLPHLEPLGKMERTLATELGRASGVAVEASALGPARLVELIGELGETCVLTCENRGQRLVWPLARGRAGKAEIVGAPGTPGLTVLPEDALKWLLTEEEPVLTVARRPMIQLTSDVAIGSLVERLALSLPAPAEFSLVPPAESTTAGAEVPRADSRELETLSAAERPRNTLEGLAPPPATAQELLGLGVPSSVPVRAASAAIRAPEAEPGPQPEAARVPSAVATLIEAAPHASVELASGELVSAERSRPEVEPPPFVHRAAAVRVGDGATPVKMASLGERVAALGATLERTPPLSRLPRGTALPAVVLAAAVMIVLFAWLVVAASSGGEATPAPSAAPVASSPAPSAVVSVAAPVPPPLDRFRVARDVALRPCAELTPGVALGDPAGGAAFHRARKALMAGDVVAAEAELCRSVLAAPTGPGAEALAEFYLGRRAVTLAKLTLEPPLAASPERRKAVELMADVRAYEGAPDAARKLLLSTLGLTGDETRVLGAVARKIAGEAEQATRGGDLPRAERLLRRAVLLAPDDVNATLALASVYARSGLPQAAEAWAERVLGLSPGHGGALVILGDLARVRGDFDEARRQYERVPEGDPARARAVEQLRRLP